MSATQCYKRNHQPAGILSEELPKRLMKDDALFAPRIYFDAEGEEIPITPEFIRLLRQNLLKIAERGQLVPVPVEHMEGAEPMYPTDEGWAMSQGYLDDIWMNPDSGAVAMVVQPLAGRDPSSWPKKTSMEMQRDWTVDGEKFEGVVTHLALTDDPVASEQNDKWWVSKMSRKVARMSFTKESTWRTWDMAATATPQKEAKLTPLLMLNKAQMSTPSLGPGTNQNETVSQQHDDDVKMPGGDNYDMSLTDEDGEGDPGLPSTDYEQFEAPPQMSELPVDPLDPGQAKSGLNACMSSIANHLRMSDGLEIDPSDSPEEFIKDLAKILKAINRAGGGGDLEMSDPAEQPQMIDQNLGPENPPQIGGDGLDPNAQVEKRYSSLMSKKPTTKRMSKGDRAINFIVNRESKNQTGQLHADIKSLVDTGRITPDMGNKLFARGREELSPVRMSRAVEQGDDFTKCSVQETVEMLQGMPAGSAWPMGSQQRQMSQASQTQVPENWNQDRYFGGSDQTESKYDQKPASEIVQEILQMT